MISWISPDELNRHVNRLLSRAQDAAAKAQGRRRKNVIDPFSSLVVASTFGIQEVRTLENVQEVESTLRGLSGALGEFHQNVLGSVAGWQNHDAGYDLECPTKQIIAEVKNKHNTMNAGNRIQVEQDLRTALRQKRGNWRAFLVHIVPKSPRRYEKELGAGLSEVDGATFYSIVTEDNDAIHDLFDYLADALGATDEIAQHCKTIFQRSLPPRVRQSQSIHSTR